MACFVVSAAAAIGVGAAKYIVKHYEKKHDVTKVESKDVKFGSEIKWSKKLAYLELVLLSGSFILAGEHVLHGEVQPFPPFLTAMQSAEEATTMLKEMGTVGVAMLAVLVGAWAIGALIADFVRFRKHKAKKATIEAK